MRGLVEDRAVVAYIAVGDEVARFHDGRVSAPITVVNNGIDTRRFIPATPASKRAARRELGIGADVPVVGFVGRLAMGKGQDVLIAMMNLLPQAHLVLIGDGDRRGTLEQQAADLGVVERVVFVGDRPDVESVLVAADVFAMASESEGSRCRSSSRWPAACLWLPMTWRASTASSPTGWMVASLPSAHRRHSPRHCRCSSMTIACAPRWRSQPGAR
ncbi:MAG: glycosyltransferase [Microthrixaceae bacterium]|nr:glycosyltransferase [Microthrixaceae bacterium]